ncbi:Protein kinase-like domain [Mycena venus]|uniref:Protein kinase-like domain n=1 Tax=Mycena venus TaxID=2733690 RepID=A0A8H6Y8F1_9AGAR|nr:Protein kinase-like domain [Mycena venus]
MSVAVGYTEFPHEKSDALKERFGFAKRVLKEALDVEVESLEPIARGYNNKVYLLKLLQHTPAAASRPLQPGCLPFPSQTPASLIFRTVRKRSQTPCRTQGVEFGRDHAAKPWMVEGMLPGIPMDEAWQTADTDTRVRMLEALADVFAKLKAIPAPDGQFGGLGYDSEGNIVLGPTCLAYDEGPFATAKEYYMAWIRGQWEDAKENPRSDGWKVDGVDQRIEKFVNEGLDSALACLDDCKPVFIHADFGMLNMLVSPTAPATITGLLDFEWSHFGPQSDEYFLSSPGPGYIYGGPYDLEPDSKAYKRTEILLSGTTPAELDPADDSFFTFKTDALLKARNVGTFSTIPHFEEIARLYWFGEYLRPWFFHEGVSGTTMGKMVMEAKAKYPTCFDKDLKVWGY